MFYGNYRTKFPKLNGQFILNFCDRYLAVEEALSAFCSYEAVAVRILERPLIDDGLPDKPTALDPLMTNVLVGNPVRGLRCVLPAKTPFGLPVHVAPLPANSILFLVRPMNSIPVLGIEEIAFEVQDIEQSVAFYRDIVGLELLSHGPQQAWFRVGAQKLALFTRDRAGSGQHFAFRIPADMAEQVRNAIVSAGFPEETMEQDDGLSVYVRDPDGNKIELYGGREGLTKRGSQPLAVAMRTFNFMKKFREFALLAPTDGGL